MPADKAQRNFTDPESRILRTSDGYIQVVEPVYGQIKEARSFRRFSLRGLAKVQGEWSLVCAAHNLLKLAKVKSPA